MKSLEKPPRWSALIVDDEPFARASLRTLLEREPDEITIFEARNGHEAASLIRGERPDVVFLDVQMPEMTGFDVVRQVGVTAMPDVIFVTAHDRFAIQAFEINALDYLLKPVSESASRKLSNAHARICGGAAMTTSASCRCCRLSLRRRKPSRASPCVPPARRDS